MMSYLLKLKVPLSDFFNVLWVINLDKNAEFQFEFLEVNIQASDFGVGDFSWHLKVSSCRLESVTLYDSALMDTLAVSFNDLDGFNWVFEVSSWSNGLYAL